MNSLSTNNVSFNGIFTLRPATKIAAKKIIDIARQAPFQSTYDTVVVQKGKDLIIGTRSLRHDNIFLEALKKLGINVGKKLKYQKGLTLAPVSAQKGEPIIQQLKTVI